MRSTSSLAIEWTRPDLAAEQWEFSHHPDKQGFYLRHGIGWEQLVSDFAQGAMVPYPRSGLLRGLPVTGSYSDYDDYAFYLAKAKRGYRKSYARMEETLQRTGCLALPAPIVVAGTGEALLFSGYRRLCLAWNYGMIPAVWLVSMFKEEKQL